MVLPCEFGCVYCDFVVVFVACLMNLRRFDDQHHLSSNSTHLSRITLFNIRWYHHIKRSDVTVRFIDENNKELGRDYFVAPLGQCTVTGYGNIKTITPRGGNNVYMVASCDLCGKNGGGSLTSAQMAVNGQVTDCFWRGQCCVPTKIVMRVILWQKID